MTFYLRALFNVIKRTIAGSSIGMPSGLDTYRIPRLPIRGTPAGPNTCPLSD